MTSHGVPQPPFLGVLMLQTRFPRLPGDVGHPASFSMPVHHRVVPGASAQRVVREGDPLLKIVPADAELMVEARVANKDVGYVRPGQPVQVKI